MKKALVISGGGCKGAYAVGVLNFLKSRPNFFADGRFSFDIYFGTSTGALIVPLASIGDMDQLLKFYLPTSAPNLVVMQDVMGLFGTGHLFNSFNLDSLVDAVFNNTRFNQIIGSGKQIGVAAVCLQTGELRMFNTQPLAANPPHYTTQRIINRNDFVDAVLASAHQPFFFNPVKIRSAPADPPRHYVDGGVREYAAIQVALDAGAEEILAILLSPETPDSANELKSTDLISVLQRTIDIFSDDVNLNDVRVPDIVSRGTDYFLAVREAMVEAGLPDSQINRILNPPNHANPFQGLAASRIHIIRPKLPLGGGPGGLRFDPVEMKSMFDRGEADARSYFSTLDANQGVPPVVLT
ncbi:patatin-like phospholipase family protein [Spirosoma validum]|uniref:Patatin-like phospholipase family protein n=1 Tax=Spirosoma validum TaxID=2771355 RepID=A0A927GCQ0_9BACT|nr:patatin-like phospholipase family protein [Spirosoma validum]MBD2752889.1 patatin-like phospholipase family protein [Spirosoma validum]